jgi:hypothetical protein
MNTVKVIIMGTLVGGILSILSLGAAYAGVLLLTEAMAIPTVLTISTLANGVILGTVGVSLSFLSTGLERSGLIILISLAVASVTVMLGSYGNGSLLPLGIYTMAILNSLLISPVTAVLTRRTVSIEETYVRG